MTFTFYSFPRQKDYSTARDEFALPGRRLRLEWPHIYIDFVANDADDVKARAQADRYFQTLGKHGMFHLRTQTVAEFASGPASVDVINSAGAGDRARIARTVRAAREELLEPPTDSALRQSYAYLQRACEVAHEGMLRSAEIDSSIFVDIYKSIESICHPLGGPEMAGRKLKLMAELRAVKRICNEGSRDTRHAPVPGQGRSAVTFAEVHETIQTARAIVRAYEHHLGLF